MNRSSSLLQSRSSPPMATTWVPCKSLRHLSACLNKLSFALARLKRYSSQFYCVSHDLTGKLYQAVSGLCHDLTMDQGFMHLDCSLRLKVLRLCTRGLHKTYEFLGIVLHF